MYKMKAVSTVRNRTLRVAALRQTIRISQASRLAQAIGRPRVMATVAPRWEAVACDEAAAARLAEALGVAPIVARLLCQRGFGDPELAARFLNPSPRSPARSDGCSPACRWRSIASRPRSRGASGLRFMATTTSTAITSTVILRRALEMLGADVVHFIPERLKDGYGLQPAAVERLHADGVAVIVSVDCGIRGADAARPRARARRRSDHHRPSRAGHRAAAGACRDQSEAARLLVSRQVSRRRGRRA